MFWNILWRSHIVKGNKASFIKALANLGLEGLETPLKNIVWINLNASLSDDNIRIEVLIKEIGLAREKNLPILVPNSEVFDFGYLPYRVPSQLLNRWIYIVSWLGEPRKHLWGTKFPNKILRKDILWRIYYSL